MASFPDYDTPFRMRTQLFRPPHTPSSVSSIYYSPDTESTRKRVRRDAPVVRSPAWDPMSSTELEGPSLLINTDYILANGGEDQRQLDLKDRREKLAEEVDYRPNRYRYNSLLGDQQPALTAGNKDVGSRKRSHSEATEMTTQQIPAPSSTTPGWGRAVFTVVGKVWDFCWTNAFRGFSAGGGNSYQVSTPTPAPKEASTWQATSQLTSDTAHESTSIPGQYPDEDAEQLRDKETWVFVPESSSLNLFAQSPSSTQFSRKIPRRITAHRPQSRRSPVNPQRPITKRPTLHGSRPISNSPLSPTGCPSTPQKQPTSPTRLSGPRFAAQVRRREREEDASFQKMNDQLKALIREGREALGSRVEVDDMDFDD
ncbi:conserved hypothetical protein [Talaromyces stipitatus ATCC 10500]|uniref:Uncharacterized protein n=1 Tax=Talaromyces stipitatus (strain ATCC 10500 / CBS 375.48 / QM 6759 / NRRL 1006) TaxID=441959 RepID=B8M406_TALSN|nr:uncharacterized protein TSTA_039480 [Talaromyces stipitatus ATCC 10500]EED20749.1 conserved hypothetical protein [Talaromyces stipitatus ATCC 10500]